LVQVMELPSDWVPPSLFKSLVYKLIVDVESDDELRRNSLLLEEECLLQVHRRAVKDPAVDAAVWLGEALVNQVDYEFI